MRKSFVFTVFIVAVFAAAQERAYDVFEFGIDRMELRALAQENGYELSVFSVPNDYSLGVTRDWCVRTRSENPVNHCGVGKGPADLYLRFDDNWENLYEVAIRSSEVDVVEALRVRFGEPDDSREEREFTSYLWFEGDVVYEGRVGRPGAYYFGYEGFITYGPLKRALFAD